MPEDIISGLERRRDLGCPFTGLVDQDLRGPGLGTVVNPGCIDLDPAQRRLVHCTTIAIACSDIRENGAVWMGPGGGPLKRNAATCADRSCEDSWG